MSTFGDQVVAILTAIIGVAIVAVLVSRNSNTANVITSTANAFAQAIGVAVSPVTGQGAGASFSGFTGSLYSPALSGFGQ